MPPQIQRLSLLTILIIVGYVAARGVLRPRSFGEYGWYRGEALREIAALPVAYAGRTACFECHGPVREAMAKSKHKEVHCESCHGASFAHAENPALSPSPITDPRFCLRCHRADVSRPAKFPQVNPAEHFGDSKCGECHRPHAPTESPSP
jgi:hypothetical protein